MASPTSSSSTIDIRILSQLPDPHSSLTFNHLSPDLTISDLKRLIQRALPSSPLLDAQRLIYRGRLLTRDEDTLLDVLGRGSLNTREMQSIHLVIRDAHPNRPRSVQPGVARTQEATLRVPDGTSQHFGAPSGLHPITQQMLPQASQPFAYPAPVASPQPVQPHSPFPLAQADMQQLQRRLLQQAQLQAQHQFAQQQAQQLAQQANPQATPTPQTPMNGNHEHTMPPSAPANTADQNGLNVLMPGGQEVNQTVDNEPTQQPGQGAPGHASTSTSSGFTPQGHRWTMTVNSSTTVLPGQPVQQQPVWGPFMPNPRMFGPMPSMPGLPGMSFMPAAQPHTMFGPLPGAHVVDTVRQLQGHLQQLRSQIPHSETTTTSSSPSATDSMTPSMIQYRRMTLHSLIQARNTQQTHINSIMQLGPQQGQTPLSQADVATLQTLNDEFRQLVRGIVEDLDHATERQAGSAPQANASVQPAPSQAVEPPTATSPRNVTAYLLNSPTGPHALVYGPEGTYTSLPQSAGVQAAAANITHADFQGAFRTLRYGGSRANTRPSSRNQQAQAEPQNVTADVNTNRENAVPQDQGPAAQQQLILQQPFQPANAQPAAGNAPPPANQPANDNAVDLGVAPFFRALWLFVRVYGVFWFFIGGNGNSIYRTIALAIMTVIYWAYQAGLFRDQIQWLQHHWDGLIRIPEGVVARQAAPGDTTRNDRLQQGTLTPAEAAQRLLDERRARGQGAFRERLRTIERALVLFAISFWPGGGERLVAERERQTREADEQRRRDAEAVLERDRAAATAESTPAEEPGAAAEAGPSETKVGPAESNILETQKAEHHAEAGSSSGVEIAAASDGSTLTERHTGS